tara:strand:- start:217 stop:687 length:471 start_codon:yes stop_codon:yes gene_type:complete
MNKSNKINNKKDKEYLKLIKVDFKKQLHNKLLYEFLRKREFNISHKNLPTYQNHIKFVENNPYRKWFLISFHFEIIGSIYILYDNGIGIDLPKKDYKIIGEILKIVFLKIKPLKAVPSIRTSNFHINVASKNNSMHKFIIDSGGVLKQHSFEFEQK